MINRSVEKRQMDFINFSKFEKEFFEKINPEYKAGLSNLKKLLENLTKEILKNNKQMNNEVNIVKSFKPAQSVNICTPKKMKRSIISNSSVESDKWKEKIRLVLESSYNACIYFLERNLKKIKYPESDKHEKLGLISSINKILRKDDFSKDINVN